MRMIHTKPVLMIAAAMTLSGTLSACGSDSGDAESDAPDEAAVASSTDAETASTDGVPAPFVQCSVCHSMEPGKNGLGPSLAGIYGKPAGAVEGYAYSKAMLDSGLAWDDETLSDYLDDPATTVPGTKMAFAGLKDPKEREEVIAFLKEN